MSQTYDPREQTDKECLWYSSSTVFFAFPEGDPTDREYLSSFSLLLCKHNLRKLVTFLRIELVSSINSQVFSSVKIVGTFQNDIRY